MVQASPASRWTDEFDVGEGVDHHSYSAIHTHASICQLKYRYQYIDRLPHECVADNLIFGTAIDLALRAIDQDLIKGRVPNVAFALQVFRASLERAFSNPDLPVVSTKGETLESLYEKGKKMIEHYVSCLDQDDVLPVELPLSFKVPLFDEKGEALPRPLVGKLDRWVNRKTARSESTIGKRLQLVGPRTSWRRTISRRRISWAGNPSSERSPSSSDTSFSSRPRNLLLSPTTPTVP